MNREPRLSLEALDPGRDEPGYWRRFREDVLARAADELARRRARAAVTVSGVVSSWGRAVVPAALAAALLAALLLVQEPASRELETTLAGVEEVLEGGLEDEPGPVLLASDAGAAPVDPAVMEEF